MWAWGPPSVPETFDLRLSSFSCENIPEKRSIRSFHRMHAICLLRRFRDAWFKKVSFHSLHSLAAWRTLLTWACLPKRTNLFAKNVCFASWTVHFANSFVRNDHGVLLRSASQKMRQTYNWSAISFNFNTQSSVALICFSLYFGTTAWYIRTDWQAKQEQVDQHLSSYRLSKAFS